MPEQQGVFENFSTTGVKTIMLAQEESRRLGHNFVGTEQLLLGLLQADKGIFPVLLPTINLATLRRAIENVIGRGSGHVAVAIPFTPRAVRVIEMANDSAKSHAQQVYPLHVLCALLNEDGGTAMRALDHLEIDTNALLKRAISYMKNAADLELTTFTSTLINEHTSVGVLQISLAVPPDGNIHRSRIIDIVLHQNPMPHRDEAMMRLIALQELKPLLQGMSQRNDFNFLATVFSGIGSALERFSELSAQTHEPSP